MTAELRCTWHSSFAAFTGYSGSSLAMTLGLDARGVAVRPLYLYGTDHDEHLAVGRIHPRIAALQRTPLHLDAPQIVYAPGDRLSKNSGRYKIGYTMFEADRIPPDWVEQINQMDEVWTPTRWGYETFRGAGITRPMHIVPLGVDPQRFAPGPPRPTLTRTTVFLSVFEWGHRKGIDLLLKAYRAAFRASDDVLLLLKVDCHRNRPADHPPAQIAALLPHPSPPVGILYNRPLSVSQLAELYQSADCFISTSRGEGWGMPILEAMACGVPAIATAWSAPTTFVSATNGYPLPIRGLVPATGDDRYVRGARWSAPDGDALVELLRHVATNPTERRAKGAQAAHDARQWTWDRAVDTVIARLRDITNMV